ncbi:MAG: hypothetical protein LBH63_03300, partial [Clostridiales Family XIII bacterium]|nr:hypothetical protein [Clostridiales Family XIII bacterium]
MTNADFTAIIEELRDRADANRLPHAFIVCGANDEERMSFAKRLAQALFSDDETAAQKIRGDNCEDLIVVRKDGDAVKVRQIEELSVALKNKPYSAERIIAVIADGDFMTEYS